MGKNKNYNAKPVPKEVVKEVVKTEEEPANEVPVEPVEEIENIVDAVVDGVEMSLNIRKNPKKEANNQIAILGKGTKIIVVNPEKTVKEDGEEWYKVRLFGGDKKDPDVNGYAMKKFIKVI